MDVALEKGEEEKFLQIFGDIADFLAIEHLIPAVDQIDYEKLAGKELSETQNGTKVVEAEICPQPFYMMQLNPDGNVVPCCAMETAYILGDAEKESAYEIWHGKKLEKFWQMQLEGKKAFYPTCAKCQQYRYAMFEEDVLDGKQDEILSKIRK